MRFRRAHITAIVAGALAMAPGAAAVTGELRTVYVQATWGPVPFSAADVERVAAETDAFFRASSSGRLSMPGVVAGPVVVDRRQFDSCDATVLRNQMPASIFDGFQRAVIVAPHIPACAFTGEANPTEVLLNGELFRALVAHELGHTLGLGHSSRWDCARCPISEYGGSFSVMGGGDGDFNAYEKTQLEWLTGLVEAGSDATHVLGPIEGPTTLPQALVVTTAASEFWFESRGQETPPFEAGLLPQPPGMVVTAGPAEFSLGSPFVRHNLLLRNRAEGFRYSYAAGEAFVQPGVFRVVVESHAPEAAALRLEWLDRTKPTRPRLRARVRAGRVRLTWSHSTDRASGVKSYAVVADGRVVADGLRADPLLVPEARFRLSRGWHRVSVFAFDRAGNRGPSATIRLRVR